MNALEMALEALTNPSTIAVQHAIELIKKELAKPELPRVFREVLIGDNYILRFYPSDTGWMCGISNEMMDAIEGQEPPSQELAKLVQWGESAISDPVVLNAQRDINGLIRQLVQTEQEPVKCTCGYAIGHPLVTSCSCKPRKEWVGLTNDEINDFSAGCHLGKSVQTAIYQAAAKLKEKNNAV
jgi:hypothetical protein